MGLHRSPPPGRCCGTDRCCQHPTVQAQDHFGPRVVQPSSLEIWNSYYRRWRRCASGKLHGCPLLWSYHHRHPSPGIQSSVRHRLIQPLGALKPVRFHKHCLPTAQQIRAPPPPHSWRTELLSLSNTGLDLFPALSAKTPLPSVQPLPRANYSLKPSKSPVLPSSLPSSTES